MANVDRPNGFTPVRSSRGGTPARQSGGYTIASAYGTSLFSGDPVKSSGTGKGIIIAPVGAVRGVFAGCQYVDAQGNQQFSPYWPASTVATSIQAWVFDDPDILFRVQADGAFVAADIGAKVDFVAGTGDAKSGRSAYELDSSDITTGDAMLIYELLDYPGNAYGANADVLILFREHELRDTLTAT